MFTLKKLLLNNLITLNKNLTLEIPKNKKTNAEALVLLVFLKKQKLR